MQDRESSQTFTAATAVRSIPSGQRQLGVAPRNSDTPCRNGRRRLRPRPAHRNAPIVLDVAEVVHVEHAPRSWQPPRGCHSRRRCGSRTRAGQRANRPGSRSAVRGARSSGGTSRTLVARLRPRLLEGVGRQRDERRDNVGVDTHQPSSFKMTLVRTRTTSSTPPVPRSARTPPPAPDPAATRRN